MTMMAMNTLTDRSRSQEIAFRAADGDRIPFGGAMGAVVIDTLIAGVPCSSCIYHHYSPISGGLGGLRSLHLRTACCDKDQQHGKHASSNSARFGCGKNFNRWDWLKESARRGSCDNREVGNGSSLKGKTGRIRKIGGKRRRHSRIVGYAK